MNKMKKKLEFEDALKRLEEIVDKISNGNSSLDESLALYQEGQDIIKTLETLLKEAEDKVEKVVEIE
ncbi:MAG: exodeoxyribonuclease VII small subunit [Bacilli bacterium]|nr:exodeoxyribonuclease VII small subunit [Bacilli bacterium]